MEKAKVYFTDFRTKANGDGLPTKLKKLIKKAGIADLDLDGKFVAIKMHFGELGNISYLRPNYARAVVEVVKELGGKPFLTDCNTLYPGSRKNALEHLYCAWENGFTPLTVGCPILIGDGLKGTDEIEVPVINNNFDYWMVGVGINYNLSSLYRTPRKVQLARSAMTLAEEKEALQLENARNAVFAAYTKYKEAYEKLSVHETSLTLAEENYRIINNRYLNDLVLITEMLDASTTKLNAELEVVNARIDIVYKYYALLRELGINNK